MVISTPNPVYSVFWLVIAFVNAAVMFISLGLDSIGLILYNCLCRGYRYFIPVRNYVNSTAQ